MLGLGYGREPWAPFEFWEYTTVVVERFFECEPSWRDDGAAIRVELRTFEEDLIARFNAAGISCAIDNKIAFGLKHKDTGQVVYVGFYDGKMSMGSAVRADGWLKPHRSSK